MNVGSTLSLNSVEMARSEVVGKQSRLRHFVALCYALSDTSGPNERQQLYLSVNTLVSVINLAQVQ